MPTPQSALARDCHRRWVGAESKAMLPPPSAGRPFPQTHLNAGLVYAVAGLADRLVCALSHLAQRNPQPPGSCCARRAAESNMLTQMQT